MHSNNAFKINKEEVENEVSVYIRTKKHHYLTTIQI